MLIGWIITIIYCIGVLSPVGQYVAVVMLYFTAAMGGAAPFMFLPFLVLGGISVAATFKVAPQGRKYSYSLQVFAMWVLATISTAFAYGALDRAWSYGRGEPEITAPPPLRVPPDLAGR
jgi:hypothetical protein